MAHTMVFGSFFRTLAAALLIAKPVTAAPLARGEPCQSALLAPNPSAEAPLETLIQSPLGNFLFTQTDEGRRLAKRRLRDKSERFRDQLLQRMIWIRDRSKDDPAQIRDLAKRWLAVRSFLFNPLSDLHKVSFLDDVNARNEGPSPFRSPEANPAAQALGRIQRAYEDYRYVRYLFSHTPQGIALIERLSPTLPYRQAASFEVALSRLGTPELRSLLFDIDYRLAVITNLMTAVHPSIGSRSMREILDAEAKALSLSSGARGLALVPMPRNYFSPRRGLSDYF